MNVHGYSCISWTDPCVLLYQRLLSRTEQQLLYKDGIFYIVCRHFFLYCCCDRHVHWGLQWTRKLCRWQMLLPRRLERGGLRSRALLEQLQRAWFVYARCLQGRIETSLRIWERAWIWSGLGPLPTFYVNKMTQTRVLGSPMSRVDMCGIVIHELILRTRSTGNHWFLVKQNDSDDSPGFPGRVLFLLISLPFDFLLPLVDSPYNLLLDSVHTYTWFLTL